MSSPLVLGAAPGPLSIILTPNTGFTAEIDAVLNGAPYLWPVGTTARITFDSTAGDVVQTWEATITGSAMTFTATPAMVASVSSGMAVRLYLNPGGSGEFLWLSGRVEVVG